MPTPEKTKSTAEAIAAFNNRTRIRTIEGFAQLPPDEQQRRLQKPENLYAWSEKILTAIEQKDVLTLQDTW